MDPSTRARLRKLVAPKRRDEFEIAIICALPLEADAVDALFDKHWPDEYGKAPGDPNAYSMGMIGRHNVVLVHMGGMGKGNAASAAANCRASFTSIKLALLVGICGGIPVGNNKEEILLGDVIISDGVIQYDLRRQFPDTFEPKKDLLDSLGRPNMEIRALLAKLKSQRNRRRLQDMMCGHLASLRDELGDTAQYPGAAQDRLFESTYRHKHQDLSGCATCAACRRSTDPVCDVAISSTCKQLKCDESELVPRHRIQQGLLPTQQSDLLKPVIHFGLIASGDTVMKSGEHRDEITKSQNVIAFEMESAGVWDNIPCVVIKGVCDYADCHKNKGWQNYAAASAASGMKAFLENWTPSILPETQNTSSWFLVPYPRNQVFVGRSGILENLKKQLGHGQDCSRESSHPRAALFGLGGTGKTQIALAYAFWIKDTCADMSVFWVHASNAQRFRQSFLSIAQECQIPEYCDDSKADPLQLVIAWLERKGQRPWLMVIDNADDTELFFDSTSQVQEGVHQHTQNENFGRYIPDCSHGSILVTTRNKQAGVRLTRGRGHSVIEVSRMDGEEAAELFRTKLADAELDADQVSELSSRLENLPLALVQAAAFIQENSITVKQYLEYLKPSKDTSALLELLSAQFETEGRDSETPHAVTATWIISFEQIRRQNPIASELLSLMSHFDRQGIPRAFLSHYNEQRQQNHGDNTAGSVGQANPALQLDKALGVLKAFSFVSESLDENLNVHRLVQLVMRKWLVKNNMSREFAGEALSTVSHLYPFGSHENRKVCGDYLPHAYAVLSQEGISSKETLNKASLLHRAAGFLHNQGRWKEAEELQVQAVKIRDRLLGAEHRDTLTSMTNLASMYWNQGRWKEAEELNVQVLETSKKVLGEEHPSTLTSMSNLASTYWNQGRWKEAEELEVQVLETSKRVLGEEYPSTLTRIGNLASTYWNQGRWKEAEKLNVQVLETSKRVLGEEHPDTLTRISNLASMYKDQGRWKEAEELEVQVLKTSKRVLGEEHPDTLTKMGNLASTYKDQGRWKEAEELEVQVLETSKRVLGEEHPDTVTSIGNLALTYWNQGRWKEAEELEVQVLETSKRVLGEEHPDTLTRTGNLASTYKNQGRWKEAEELEAEMLETSKRVLGEEHPDTLTSISNLASTYWNQGRWKEAEELEVQVLETSKKVLGEEHLNTLTRMGNLASTYKNQGRWKEAEELNVQVLETSKRVLGEEHPGTLRGMNNLAFTLKGRGQHAEAIKLMKRCVQLRTLVLGVDHPYTLSSAAVLISWQTERRE